ncbi:MAG: DUF4968 domain-containing protein [Oscillospiraceae bacterium]|nr:DUF4968 domain-containing protein [Oscillospiraceae bacterium]
MTGKIEIDIRYYICYYTHILRKEAINMITRQIERREILRGSVSRAELREVLPYGVTLSAYGHGDLQKRREISSADPNMFELAKAVGSDLNGIVRIDVLSDSVIRLRYSQAKECPENITPMIAGSFDPPADYSCQDDDGFINITTSGMEIKIQLDPYRVEIYDRQKRLICGIGGPEKNNFGCWDSVNTGICRDLETGGPIAAESFDLRYDEHIYGLGEKFIKLDKTGQTIDLNMKDALGTLSPRSYKNIPFFVSDKGYGVYFNHSSLMTYWVGSMSACDIQVAANDDFLDYYIFTGSIKKILADYTQLTGKGSLPPLWSFGYWQSKISYSSAEETLEIARKMRENKVPFDVLHLDTHWFERDWFCNLEFCKERFPDIESYFAEMTKLGVKISLWQLPYIPQGSKLFDDIKNAGGFVKNKEGGIYNLGLCFTPGFKGIVGVVDFTNPAGSKVYLDAIKRLLRLGARAIKTDFGEAAPADGVYYDGTPGQQMHNLYPLLYNKAVFEATCEVHGREQGMVWARSAWAGGQRYPVHWGGDNSPNYHNMIPQFAGGLSLGMSGFQFWSQDIGGFQGQTSGRLLIRWMQAAMFMSHSRIHGNGDRELYKFDKETFEICREFICLRYRLLPYIYASAVNCVKDSLPMMMPLVIEYQDDPNTAAIDSQWLFGQSLLVAPICDDGSSRSLYLPGGMWTDWWSGERIQGGRWITVHADIDSIPLYIREGAIIPMGPEMQYAGEKETDSLTVKISLFEQNGKSYLEVPIDNKSVKIEYICENGKHDINIDNAGIDVNIERLG